MPPQQFLSLLHAAEFCLSPLIRSLLDPHFLLVGERFVPLCPACAHEEDIAGMKSNALLVCTRLEGLGGDGGGIGEGFDWGKVVTSEVEWDVEEVGAGSDGVVDVVCVARLAFE